MPPHKRNKSSSSLRSRSSSPPPLSRADSIPPPVPSLPPLSLPPLSILPGLQLVQESTQSTEASTTSPVIVTVPIKSSRIPTPPPASPSPSTISNEISVTNPFSRVNSVVVRKPLPSILSKVNAPETSTSSTELSNPAETTHTTHSPLPTLIEPSGPPPTPPAPTLAESSRAPPPPPPTLIIPKTRSREQPTPAYASSPVNLSRKPVPTPVASTIPVFDITESATPRAVQDTEPSPERLRFQTPTHTRSRSTSRPEDSLTAVKPSHARSSSAGVAKDKDTTMRRISSFFNMKSSRPASPTETDAPPMPTHSEHKLHKRKSLGFQLAAEFKKPLSPPGTSDEQQEVRSKLSMSNIRQRVVTPPRQQSLLNPNSSPSEIPLPTTPYPQDSPPRTTVGLDGQRDGSSPSRPASPGLHGQKLKKSKNLFGRRKVDLEEDTVPKAWRLERGDGEPVEYYETRPLESGEKVPDLWDNSGDTLIYLSPPPIKGFSSHNPQPSFRINSSPLLFSTLACYIHELDRPATPTPPPTLNLAPNDLFLDFSASTESALHNIQKFQDITPRTGSDAGSTRQSTEGLGQEPLRVPLSPPRTQHPSPLIKSTEIPARYALYYSKVIAAQPGGGTSISEVINRQKLLNARNLFSFLDFKPLVATVEAINAFQVLERIYDHLFVEPVADNGGLAVPVDHVPYSPIEVGNGQVDALIRRRSSSLTPFRMADDLPTKIFLAQSHLDFLIDELKPDDIREEGERVAIAKGQGGLKDSLEAIYTGEKWRSARLFIEGFLHTVGRWEEIKESKHPLIEYLSPTVLMKLDRAALDLSHKVTNITERVLDFQYPEIFAGRPELKLWKAAFLDTRKLVLNHLKFVYGSWPPRAGKKGKGGGYGGERGGLNRMVLKRLEADVGALWALIVNWDAPRYPMGGFNLEQLEDESNDADSNPLRRLMEEFDKAQPPVQPRPMFDMPRIPSTEQAQSGDEAAKRKKTSKKLKGEEAVRVLEAAWNPQPQNSLDLNPVIGDFMNLEVSHSQGKTIEEIAEARKGRWLFIYAVLQSLPMLTVDTPAVKYVGGVEYFLCQGYNGFLPWEEKGRKGNNRPQSMVWQPSSIDQLGTFGGPLLPTPAEDDEVAAAYHRSYCWRKAAEWCAVKQAEEEERERIRMEEDQRLYQERERLWREQQAGLMPEEREPFFPNEGNNGKQMPEEGLLNGYVVDSEGYPVPVPEALLPSTKEKRMTRYRSGSQGWVAGGGM